MPRALVAVSRQRGNIYGFDDPVEIKDDEEEAAEPAVSDTKVFAPLTGEVVALANVPDATFAEGVLGQGLAIVPTEGFTDIRPAL